MVSVGREFKYQVRGLRVGKIKREGAIHAGGLGVGGQVIGVS